MLFLHENGNDDDAVILSPYIEQPPVKFTCFVNKHVQQESLVCIYNRTVMF